MADEFDPLEVMDALLAGVVTVPADVAKRFPAHERPNDDAWREELEAFATGCEQRGLIAQLSDAACGKQPAPQLRELLAASTEPGGEE